MAAWLTLQGLPQVDASIVAQCLVRADLRGIDAHGLQFLPQYLERVRRGLINPRPALAPRRVTVVAATLDGDNGFGFVAAAHVLPALEAGFVAMVFSNASRAMPPRGGREALLGTNPFAAGAPAGRQQPFLLDMSPAVAARGKIRRRAMCSMPRVGRPPIPTRRHRLVRR
jgi:LDH2 family malate/lactate/ureidoglycolate dehydrogenase